MNLSILFVVFKDLKNRKFSSFLTFFAISLGILSIFVIFLISLGFTNSIQKQFEKVGTNLLIISPEGSSSLDFSKTGLTDNDLKLVDSRPYIKSSSGFYIRSTQIEFDREFKSTIVMGTDITKTGFENFNMELNKGRFGNRNEKYSMIIGSKVAKDLFNKRVEIGNNVYINGIKFKVLGILKSVGNPSDDSNVYVNIDSLRKIYNKGNFLSTIYARVNKGYNLSLASKNIETYLENRHGKDTISVKTFKQMISSFSNILNIVKFTLAGIAFISLIVGSLGILNTMFVIISEKTKEIGILKALGASNENILFIYVFQSGLYGFFGGILGMIFGILLSFGFESWAQKSGYSFLTISINYPLIITLLIFSFFIGCLSGFIPAYSASKLKIVETFRK